MGILSVLRDITERVAAEEKLAHYQENLEELVEERTAELENYHDLFIEREFRIKELRDKLKEYESR